VYDTVPFPCPVDPETIVSHSVVVVAVHEHPEAATTATVPLPPFATKLCC
jgi:hypothetical protein